eukprot:gnl/TRDRNA2_/TRDRNA2_100476_c1_seq1.p1 gnl/TRDRNA2_/TRDRNA2_100476_c1~~gnl/TRDRNA2_/TRDRNA2_100476_c1_seq1.p1  ORF type:complete len:207 (-),score=26.50 gnl/TRDRNA2_/TRDRNA2_100476_c1_seq1:96-716(-)
MFNITVVFYMCWTSAGNAVCAIVGNLLGAHKNGDIPPLLRAAFFLSGCTSVAVAVGYEVAKGWLAMLFTRDQRVCEVMRNSSVGLVLSVPLYAEMMTFYGALRGANRQKPGIVGTLVGYWLIGLPLGAVFGCIWHWPTPLVGVWLGNVIALAIVASWVLSAVFIRIDWLSVRRVTDVAAALLADEDSSSTRELSAVPSREEGASTN